MPKQNQNDNRRSLTSVECSVETKESSYESEMIDWRTRSNPLSYARLSCWRRSMSDRIVIRFFSVSTISLFRFSAILVFSRTLSWMSIPLPRRKGFLQIGQHPRRDKLFKKETKMREVGGGRGWKKRKRMVHLESYLPLSRWIDFLRHPVQYKGDRWRILFQTLWVRLTDFMSTQVKQVKICFVRCAIFTFMEDVTTFEEHGLLGRGIRWSIAKILSLF